MARMHPEDIEGLEGPTEGERKVFRFLREAARPDQDFIGWYEPTIGEQGKEPDFVPSVDFPDIKKRKGQKKKSFYRAFPGPFLFPEAPMIRVLTIILIFVMPTLGFP